MSERSRLLAALSLGIAAWVLVSCGSSGPKRLSSDDFVAAVSTECRTATRALDKLDFSEKHALRDAGDVVQTMLDALTELRAPQALADDFLAFEASLEGQIAQFAKLERAIRKGDSGLEHAISDKLDRLAKAGDEAADLLGASKCVGVTSGAPEALATDASTLDTSSGSTEPPDTTMPATTAEPATTAPATTAEPPTTAPATTAPATTAEPTTAAETGSDGATITPVSAADASATFLPIPGYTWDSIDLSTYPVPDDVVLQGVISEYFAGRMIQTADPNLFVEVEVTFLAEGADWSPDELSAFYQGYLFDNPSDITTPTLGLHGQTSTYDKFTAAAVTGPGVGITMFSTSDVDLPTLFDAFVQAQSSTGTMGG